MDHARGLNKRAKRSEQAADLARKRRVEPAGATPSGSTAPGAGDAAPAPADDIEGRSPVPVGCIGNVFNPGWETDCAALETTRLCPGGYSYHTDTVLCQPSCWWPAQVPDEVDFPDWLKDCGNIYKDWQKLCFVPD